MTWSPVTIKLKDVLARLNFLPEQQHAFQAALSNDDPIITYDNHDRNISLAEAMKLKAKDAVIGPPLGLRDYMTQINALIVDSAHVFHQDSLERRLNIACADMPSTEDEIRNGNVGVYSTQPRLSLLRSQRLTLEQFNEEYKALMEQKAALMPEVFRQQVTALCHRIYLDLKRQPLHIIENGTSARELDGFSL